MQSLLLIADYANKTMDGKLNVMGIFRQVNARKFPAKHPHMVLVIKLQAELGEDTSQARALTVRLLDEDAREIMNLTTKIQFPKRVSELQPEFNAIVNLNNISFPHPGR